MEGKKINEGIERCTSSGTKPIETVAKTLLSRCHLYNIYNNGRKIMGMMSSEESKG